MNTKFESYIGYEDLPHTIHVTPLTATLFKHLGLSLNAAIVFDHFLKFIERKHGSVVLSDISNVEDHLIVFKVVDLCRSLYGFVGDQVLRKSIIPSLVDAGLFEHHSFKGNHGVCYKVYYTRYYKLIHENFIKRH